MGLGFGVLGRGLRAGTAHKAAESLIVMKSLQGCGSFYKKRGPKIDPQLL